jgi:hypothetical protein
MARNTAKYMKQVKKNMKADPNWSNVKKEENRMKEAEKANKKSVFDRFKKKIKTGEERERLIQNLI